MGTKKIKIVGNQIEEEKKERKKKLIKNVWTILNFLYFLKEIFLQLMLKTIYAIDRQNGGWESIPQAWAHIGQCLKTTFCSLIG